jgi:hypothetical protein
MNSNKHNDPASYLLHAGFLIALFFDPEGDGEIFLRDVSWILTDDISLYPRR